MQIFKTNEFFCGLSIPDPGTIDPIEKKLPRDLAGPDGVDFMKVASIIDVYCRNKTRFQYTFIANESSSILQKCLDKDPAKRWTCEQLLSHPFFKNFSFKFPDHEINEFERLRRVSNSTFCLI